MTKATKAWDAAVASALQKASTPACGREALKCPLAVSAEPKANFMPGKARSLAHLDPKLRDQLRDLVAGEAPWPFYLWGSVGGGKSSAALLLHDYCGGLYFPLERFIAESILAMKGQLQWEWSYRPVITEPAFWEAISEAKLLTLDDIGSRREPPSDAHYERLKTALDLREGKPTVVVSNIPLDELVKLYDDRIGSRLAAGTVFGLHSHDRRFS